MSKAETYPSTPIGSTEDYLRATPMLDYRSPAIEVLVQSRHWRDESEFGRIRSIYNFVRDEILFGYNSGDDIPASKVLSDGFGQVQYQGNSIYGLLRSCSVPCRIHGFTIDKKLQKGAMTGIVYAGAPREIFHSWVEVLLDGVWYELEAFILDSEYLSALQRKFPGCRAFCGYGAAVSDLQHPTIEFNRNSTYIQSEGIVRDFGVYPSPDELLREHHQTMSPLKNFLFRHLGRHLMNRNVRRLRKG